MERRIDKIEGEHQVTSSTLTAHLATCTERSIGQKEHNEKVTQQLDKLFGKVNTLDRRILVVASLSAGAGSGLTAGILKFFGI